MIPVVQIVEQHVQLMSRLEARGFRNRLVIGVVETVPEAAEHPGDRQFEFGVTVKRGRIEYDGAVGAFGYVAAPQIAVKKSWFDLYTSEQIGNLQLNKRVKFHFIESC